MKLRLSKKVCKVIGTTRERSYKKSTLWRALGRRDRTKTSRQANQFWFNMMDFLGPAGRAAILMKHDPAASFRILMSAEESKWGRFA